VTSEEREQSYVTAPSFYSFPAGSAYSVHFLREYWKKGYPLAARLKKASFVFAITVRSTIRKEVEQKQRD